MTFSLVVLKKATDHFDKTHELGSGGHGTVYRGILANGHVVAIKRSKATVQKEIDGFTNEVAVLLQMNHRNVVRLYGCLSLGTRVPLILINFVPVPFGMAGISHFTLLVGTSRPQSRTAYIPADPGHSVGFHSFRPEFTISSISVPVLSVLFVVSAVCSSCLACAPAVVGTKVQHAWRCHFIPTPCTSW
jgi:serine/threonine protein kinase